MLRKTLITASLLASSACGIRNPSLTSTHNDGSSVASQDIAHNAADGEKSDSKKFLCVDQYVDQTLQANPLWEETFEASVGVGSEGVTKPFGVSPGT